jgi:hypothetical protein
MEKGETERRMEEQEKFFSSFHLVFFIFNLFFSAQKTREKCRFSPPSRAVSFPRLAEEVTGGGMHWSWR